MTVNKDKKCNLSFCKSLLRNCRLLFLSINEEGVSFLSHDLVKLSHAEKVFRLLPKKNNLQEKLFHYDPSSYMYIEDINTIFYRYGIKLFILSNLFIQLSHYFLIPESILIFKDIQKKRNMIFQWFSIKNVLMLKIMLKIEFYHQINRSKKKIFISLWRFLFMYLIQCYIKNTLHNI